MADNCAKIDICLVSIVFSQLHTQEQVIDLSIIHCPNTFVSTIEKSKLIVIVHYIDIHKNNIYFCTI